MERVHKLDDVHFHQLDQLEHYFRQYKAERELVNPATFLGRLSRDEAIAPLAASLRDYDESIGG